MRWDGRTHDDKNGEDRSEENDDMVCNGSDKEHKSSNESPAEGKELVDEI